MTARLYEVTVTEMRDGFTRAYVHVYHVAAETRAKAVKQAIASSFTSGADAVVSRCSCIEGRITKTKYRVLKEPQA